MRFCISFRSDFLLSQYPSPYAFRLRSMSFRSLPVLPLHLLLFLVPRSTPSTYAVAAVDVYLAVAVPISLRLSASVDVFSLSASITAAFAAFLGSSQYSIDLRCRCGRCVSCCRSTHLPTPFGFGRCHGIRRVIIGVRAAVCEHTSALTSAYSTAYFTRKTPG